MHYGFSELHLGTSGPESLVVAKKRNHQTSGVDQCMYHSRRRRLICARKCGSLVAVDACATKGHHRVVRASRRRCEKSRLVAGTSWSEVLPAAGESPRGLTSR